MSSIFLEIFLECQLKKFIRQTGDQIAADNPY